MTPSLLPFRFKYPGWILLAAGTVMAACYAIFDFVIRVPVFAAWSAFLETRTFAVVQTNIADELIMLLFLAGFLLVIFSREKNERKGYLLLRFRAWILAVLSNTALLALSVLFVFGTGFIIILFVHVFSLFALYLAFFYGLKRRAFRKPAIHTKV